MFRTNTGIGFKDDAHKAACISSFRQIEIVPMKIIVLRSSNVSDVGWRDFDVYGPHDDARHRQPARRVSVTKAYNTLGHQQLKPMSPLHSLPARKISRKATYQEERRCRAKRGRKFYVPRSGRAGREGEEEEAGRGAGEAEERGREEEGRRERERGRKGERRSEKVVGSSARQRIERSKYNRETTKTGSIS